MKHIIPKQSKTRFMFYGMSIRDLIVLGVCLIVTVLFMTANFTGHYIVALIWAVIAALLFFLRLDDRLYYELYIIILFLCTRKHWDGESQNGVQSIDGDIIKFKNGSFAGVLRIDSTEFFLLREEVQDRMIACFSALFKNLNLREKASIYRLDRPILLDGCIEALKKNTKCRAPAKGSAEEYIRRIRTQELEKINTNDNAYYYNAFYFVLYGSSAATVNKALLADVRELVSCAIKAERIGGEELVAFCKRTRCAAFDERKVPVLSEERRKFIAPADVRFKAKEAIVDGIRESTMVLTHYPTTAYNAWATELCALPYSKVVISVTPVETEKAIKAIDNTAGELKDKYSRSSKLSSDSNVQAHYESLQALIEDIQNGNDVMLNVCTTVTSYDYGNVGRQVRREMRKAVHRLGFRTSVMMCRQAEAYAASGLNSVFPASPTYIQGIQSSSLAAAYPFVDTQLIDEKGVMLGQNGAPVLIDFSKRDADYRNSNIVVLGGVGGGKSFFAKSLFTYLWSEGYRLFLFDPENEYTILAENLGGKVIDMGLGGNIINPFAVLPAVSGDDETAENLLLAHITFLEEFFRTTLDGLGREKIELVLSLLPELYRRKGLSEKTDFKTYKGEFPTFNDFTALFEERIEKEELSESERGENRTILTFLSKFANGGRYSYLWNGQTNLNAGENFVVFNFQGLLANANKTIAAGQMLLLTQYLNNELISNYNRIKRGENVPKIVIGIDEAHVYIDPHNPIALRFMKNSAKRCRKYEGLQVVLTQSVNDFLGNEDLERESKSVITECQYTFVFPLNASGAADFLKLYEKLDITLEEQNAILDLKRGHTFFIAHQRLRTVFSVETPAEIRALFEKVNAMEEIAKAEEVTTQSEQEKPHSSVVRDENTEGDSV